MARHQATNILMAAANLALGSVLRSQGLPPMTLGMVAGVIITLIARPALPTA